MMKNVREYGVFYNGAYHIFRIREEANKFVENMSLTEKSKCIKLYKEVEERGGCINMKYSKLKNDLEILELNHKHELNLIRMKQEQAKNELLSKCTHKYDDDTSAKTFAGTQWDNWTECAICGKAF